jgi:hypothetical protein
LAKGLEVNVSEADDDDQPEEWCDLIITLMGYWHAGDAGELLNHLDRTYPYEQFKMVPEPILELVKDHLWDFQYRCDPPSPDELKRMCLAAMRVRPTLRDRLGLDVNRPVEPKLPKPPRSKMPPRHRIPRVP